MAPLSTDECTQFEKAGYLVLDGWLDGGLSTAMARDVDRFAEAEPLFDGRNVADYPALVDFVTHEPLLALIDQLMGESSYAIHHCHAARHRAGLDGVKWHHDYEQIPQTNRSHRQIHALAYLNGLDGTIGDLLVWPKSHRAVMRRDACWMAGTDLLPGAVVLDHLGPGSVVLVHSALVHARRAQPGGEHRDRYFVDVAFCELGIRWPSYGREGWELMLQRLAAAAPEAVARRRHLFDVDAFFDIGEALARLEGRQGSLALDLPAAVDADRPEAGAIPVVG